MIANDAKVASLYLALGATIFFFFISPELIPIISNRVN